MKRLKLLMKSSQSTTASLPKDSFQKRLATSIMLSDNYDLLAIEAETAHELTTTKSTSDAVEALED